MSKTYNPHNNINQEESFEILMKRTKEISVPVSEININEQRICCLNFDIQNTGYAISAEYVKSVISSFKITDIPDIPDFILGIIDYRGKIIAVFDFHIFLDYEATKINSNSNLVLVSYSNEECGILVNNIYDIHSINVANIEKNISTVKKNTSKYLNGMIRINDKLFGLIDIPKIFESEKIREIKDLSSI